jgi:AraC-like DNA-binding protein
LGEEGANQATPDFIIANDIEAIAWAAVDHLHQRGVRNLALVHSTASQNSLKQRQRAIASLAKSRRIPFSIVTLADHPRQLRAWLLRQPQVLGLIVTDPSIANSCALACQQAGLTIPHAVKVMVLNEHETLNQLCSPPLSAVLANQPYIGRTLLDLLDLLNVGQMPNWREIAIPPLGVLARASTGNISTGDASIDACLPALDDGVWPSVDSLAAALGLSHRQIQRRIQASSGKTLQQLHAEQQLNRAFTMLNDSGQPILLSPTRPGFAVIELSLAHFRRDTA